MKNETILPADIYTVVSRTIMSDPDRKIITMLYQPIIGYTAVSLYFTLIDDLDKKEVMSEDLTHHHLMATMQLKLSDIVLARKKLEAIGLLKTYLHKTHIHHFVYALYAPLTANEFLNHPILNVVLYNNLGKKEYDKIVGYYKIPKITLKDFEDITCSFHEVFTPVSGNVFLENDNIMNRNEAKITLKSQIDFDLLISSIPKNMIHDKCFSQDIKELICNLAFVYQLDTMTMKDLVRDSLNEKGLIDRNALRKACRNYYQFENSEKLPTLIYSKQPDYLCKPIGDTSNWAKMVSSFETVTPYNYLRSKYKDGEPSIRDLKLIESLLVDLKLKPGVVNVLISYVLRINNQKLSRNYLETIAGQWKRLHIETVEEAMKICEKEHKKMKRLLEKKSGSSSSYSAKKKEEQLPDWFDKKLEEHTASEEDVKEMEQILKEFA